MNINQREPKFKVGDVVHYVNGYGVYWGTWIVKGVDEISYSNSGFGYYLEGFDNQHTKYPHKEESLFPAGDESSAIFAEMVSAAREYYSDPDCVRIGVEDLSCENARSKIVGRLTLPMIDLLENSNLLSDYWAEHYRKMLSSETLSEV